MPALHAARGDGAADASPLFIIQSADDKYIDGKPRAVAISASNEQPRRQRRHPSKTL